MYRQRSALITGASAGLGAVFAQALARRGAERLVLVARRETRLKELAAQIEAEHGTPAVPIALDLSGHDAGERLMAELSGRGIRIDVLINNAGFGLRGDFLDLPLERQLRMIDLNARLVTELCHRLGRGMAARGFGGILNVASTAAFQPGPWMAVYYATKAHVLSLSEALHEELKPKGVRVTALCPGATRTEFAEVADMQDTRLFTWFADTAAPVVEAGLDALERGRALVVPGLGNRLMAAGVRFAPRMMVRRIVAALQR